MALPEIYKGNIELQQTNESLFKRLSNYATSSLEDVFRQNL
jgi:hypothetical protein